MPIEVKRKILMRHPYLHMRLAHTAIGTFPCYFKAHAMTVNRLIIVLADSGDKRSRIRDSVSGKTFPMQSGNLYFIPCNHPSDWDFSSDLFFVSLHFNLELFYGFDVFSDNLQCFAWEARELAAEIKELIHRDEEIITLCRLNEIIFNLCVKLLSMQPEPLRADIGKQHNYQKVFDFIQKDGNATTTVEMLAEMLGMRNNVFSRKFTRDFGITPKNLLLTTLTRKASEILLIPGTTVKQTANKLKFSSEYYFSSFFKRQTGISPKEFQRHNR